MSFRDVKSRTAVLESLAECDLLGVDRFRTAYGFGPALTYTLQHDGREYDSKAILAVAHKYQFPDAGALKASDFSGGKAHAARHLTRLGFAVTGVEPGEKDWRVHEVEAVVADYFDMMEAVRRGEPINKARRVRTLSTTIVGRNEASIGRKHGNISSILRDLDVPWLKGFTPLPNTQLLLEAIVNDWLSGHPDFYDRVVSVVKRNDPEYPVEVAPPNTTLLNPTAYSRRAVRVDFAARDESNRALGRAGERWALDQLKARMIDGGGGDLAGKVEWVADTLGDGLGYDIASYAPNGEPEFVEVKTTNLGPGAPFIVSENEVAASAVLGRRYVLMRIFNFSTKPQFYVLRGPLGGNCQLLPRAFRALPRFGTVA